MVVENFRPGVIDRLGLGYDACKALKSDIIFASVSGYGQRSPLRDYPAIDNVIQAASAMTMQSGEDGGGPVRIGFAPVDTYTGMTAAYAIVNALFRRERTGEGQFIDASMMDSAVAFMTSLGGHLSGPGQGSSSAPAMSAIPGQPTAGIFQTFRTAAHVSLGVVQNVAQFVNLSKALGHPEWGEDPRFRLAGPGARTTR